MSEPLPPTQSPGPPAAPSATSDTLLTQHPTAPPTMTAPPPAARTIAGYAVERELGRGGMGVVYQARDLKLGRTVALKMILSGAHAGTEALTRFLAEAQAVAGLRHPNIVQVYEIGQHEGLPYFTLEFVEGGTLASRLRGEPQTPHDAARLVEQLARAVAHAHEAGVIHRDLKPANILLTSPGADATGLAELTPKITDFGLAKRIEGGSGMTQSGAVVGTPSYMPPEQAAGKTKEVGTLSDVYSLGAILYETLTGRPPFRASTAAETLLQVIVDEPVPVGQLQPRTPRDLQTICHKCLHKDAARRYASALALADDLERFQKGEPIQARPVGRIERGWRWCRRNPVVAALLALVVVLIVGAGTAITWQWQAAVAALKGRALAQVNALRDAAPGAVPTLLEDLAAQRETVLPRLRELWQEGGDRGRRMRVGLALLPVEPDFVRDELAKWMLEVRDPAEAVVIRDALAPHAGQLREGLWRCAKDEMAEAADRFRCLAALAAFAHDDARWTTSAEVAVAEMLKANPLHLGVWVKAFQPVGATLSGPLSKVFRAEKSAERREFAAIVLSDYVGDQPEALANLLLDADPKQYAVLFPVLQRYRDEAVERMRRELKLSAHAWNDPPLAPKWSAVPSELQREIEAAGGLVEERWALCQALPLERVAAVSEALRPAGYRPIRVRPYPGRSGEPSRTGVVWTRDGREWRLATSLTAAAVKERDAARQQAGSVPVDVAGFSTPDGTRYALVAVKALQDERAGLYVEASDADHKERQDVFKNDGYLPATMASWKDAAGVLRYAGVWSKSPTAATQWNAGWLYEREAHEGAVLDGELVPLDVALSPPEAVQPSQARHPLQAAGVLLMARRPLELAAAALAVPPPLPERGLYGSTWQFDATREAVGLSGLAAEEHLTRCRELATKGYRPAALSLTQLAGKPVAASLWHRPAPKQEAREHLARRQATAAATLLKLNAPTDVWDVFRFRPDPEVRSQLIWRSGQVGVSAEQIVARLEVEADTSARRALILTLGEFTVKEMTPALQQRIVPRLLSWYRDDPDAGVHAAIDWLLWHKMEGPDQRLLDWQQAAALKKLDEELRRRDRAGGERRPPDRRRWYVNGQGQTEVLIPGPVEFRMGAPHADPERFSEESPHWRRIPRSFAIASKSVTVEQFQRFLQERPDVAGGFTKRYSPVGAGPIIKLSWFAAAQYCNWLSAKEGLEEQEWCYPRHADIKDGMKLSPDYLSRKGYRLPTEAEWEYAARAETTTSRSYGSSVELLHRYGWYILNAQDKAWPVGQKRPNDFGLFDVQGNVYNWVADGYLRYRQGRRTRAAIDDTALYGAINLDITDSEISRVLRGGSFVDRPSDTRTSFRNSLRPASRNDTVGLRPARTLP